MSSLGSRIEHVPDHVFEKGETVYVIDSNEFDIYSAKITAIDGDKYTVYYPDYETDEVVTETIRMLPQTQKNNAEFNRQEAIRLRKEKRAKQSSDSEASAGASDDDEFGESDEEEKKKKKKPRKTKTEKKEKPKKEPKPKKEKKEKPKKEPKPKKEKKDKKKKQSSIYFREAYQNGVRNSNDFVIFLEQKYPDKELKMDTLAKGFDEFIIRVNNTPEGEDFQDEYSDDEQMEDDAPEEYKDYGFENVHVSFQDANDLEVADEIIFKSWITVEDSNKERLMNIEFGKDSEDNDTCNAFIFETEDGKKYLILNGQKIELKQEDPDPSTEYFYSRDSTRIEGYEPPTSQYSYAPLFKKGTSYRCSNKPAAIDLWEEMNEKEKKRKEKVAPIGINTNETGLKIKARSHKANLSQGYLEGDDSDD